MQKCENCYHKKVCINGANYKAAENCKQYKPESLFPVHKAAEKALKERDT